MRELGTREIGGGEQSCSSPAYTQETDMLRDEDLVPHDEMWSIYKLEAGTATARWNWRQLEFTLQDALQKVAADSVNHDRVFHPLLFTSMDVFAFFADVGYAELDESLGASIYHNQGNHDTGYVIVRPGGDIREWIANGCSEWPMDYRVAGSFDHGRDDGQGGGINGWTPDLGGSIILSLLHCYAHGHIDVLVDFNAPTRAGNFANVAYRESSNSPCSTYDHTIEIAESFL
jgi:hypothetical protein